MEMQRERVEELQLLIGVEDVLVGRMLGAGLFESGLQSRLPFEFGGEHLVDEDIEVDRCIQR